MAGYSGMPLAKKLGIKEGRRVVLRRALVGFAATLGELPKDVDLGSRLDGTAAADVIVLFVKSRGALEEEFGRAAAKLDEAGGLWVAWPKRASGVPTDLTENVVREIGLRAGLVDNKVCAIDEVWSGLRMVVRVENRRRRSDEARQRRK